MALVLKLQECVEGVCLCVCVHSRRTAWGVERRREYGEYYRCVPSISPLYTAHQLMASGGLSPWSRSPFAVSEEHSFNILFVFPFGSAAHFSLFTSLLNSPGSDNSWSGNLIADFTQPGCDCIV